ncbi:hypothetical protein JCM21900_001608 [Sporobolomyces salmonicolor]
MNIDKSLDDIISTKKRSRGPRRQRGNPPASSKQQAGVAAPAPAAVPAAQAAAANVHVGDKIIVSNLPDDVNEVQIKELFTTTVGPVRTVSLSYNAQGKSKGIATVGFNKAEHATSAYQQYNKRLIDGKRPMKVEIIVDPSRVARGAGTPLTARLGVTPARATVAAAGGSTARAPRAPRAEGATRGAGGGGRRRGGGRGGRSEDRPKPTVESLDAEMSDWQAQASAAGNGEGASA